MQALVMPERRLSHVTAAVTPPMKERARVCEPIQSDSPCVHVASAYVRLDAPSTATNSCAVLTSPVNPLITSSVVPA
jgi:hypothetical protein